jgi:hypothetical protein
MLNDIDVNYYHIQDLLNNNLLPKVVLGRKNALNAIYFCYMKIDGYDQPPYGWLVYTLGSNNLKYQSSLSSLVSTPIASSTPPAGYELFGEPNALSLIDRNPDYEQNGASRGRSFPPAVPTSTPFQEGYFERTLRALKIAQSELIKNQANMVIFKEKLNSITTATTTEQTTVVNGRTQTATIDNIASSTTALSDLVNSANSQYNDFIQRYKTYVSDAINSEQSGAGPGTMSGGGADISDMLSAVNDALIHPDELGAEHGNNLFYCEYKE